MAEITFRKIADEIETLHDPPYKQLLITSPDATANGAAAASTKYIAVVPYRSWRVINVGFVVINVGASTVAESISFGIEDCDLGSIDVDLFGTFTQDVTALKNVSAGDIYQRVNYAYLATPYPPTLNGTPVWSAGDPDGFLQWFNKQGFISVTKNLVAGSTFTARGWVLIEIGEV